MSLDRLILGTAGLGGVWGKADPDESISTILSALKKGICAIDTAPAYGDAEVYVEQALRQWEGERPAISSKVGRLRSYAADEAYYDYSDAGMQRSVEKSLEALGVPALDILFLHDPEAIPQDEAGRVVRTFEGFRERGYARKLGLGGNCPAWFYPYLRPGAFDVVMEFNRLNACNITALRDMLPFCSTNHIRYFSASPLNMGLLGRNFEAFRAGRPAWLPEGHVEAAGKLRVLAQAGGMALPELAHRFLLSLPFDFCIVMGASNAAELENSIGAFEKGPLPEDVVNEILKICIRYPDG